MTMPPLLRSDLFVEHPTFILDIDTIDLPACKYVDFRDIPTCVPSKQFSLLVFNIRSCRKNFSEFECIFYEYLGILRVACVFVPPFTCLVGYKNYFTEMLFIYWFQVSV